MKLRDLLLAILRVANKARDVARIIRSEHALLELLVQEKKGLDKNERFVQDFKTLADVLIQQMVSHDIAAEVGIIRVFFLLSCFIPVFLCLNER